MKVIRRNVIEKFPDADATPFFEEKLVTLSETFADLPSHFVRFNKDTGDCDCLRKFVIADTPANQTDFIKRETVAYQLEQSGENIDRTTFDPETYDKATYAAPLFDPRGFAGRRFEGPTIRMWPEPQPVHPPLVGRAGLYRAQQRYLDAFGINVDAVANEPRAAVRLVDIEQGWNLDHEELRHLDIRSLRTDSAADWRFHGHGASVLGILAGRGDTSGVTGIMPADLEVRVISEYWKYKNTDLYCYSTAETIIHALRTKFLQRGDVLLIESQYWDEDTGLLLPAEADPFTRYAIACAIKHRGIIVIEAAGNGGIDLDGIVRSDGSRFDVHNPSGAIVVAAATSVESESEPYLPTFFTNRGRYIDCFAWGEQVTTCGDGETSRENDEYIPDFSGTSAAAAIIAGVASVVQSIARARGRSLTPAEMRDLLRDPANGKVPARGSAPIGVMPDLAKVVAALDRKKAGRELAAGSKG